MTTPPKFSSVLLEAKKQVRAHPKHELILPTRKKIWRNMGPLLIGERNRAIHGTGLYRRTMLAVYAVQFVLPIWEKHWPTKAPHLMLDMAQQYIRKEIDFDDAWEAANEFSGELEDTQDIPKEAFHSIYVGYAAARAVGVALKDEWCDEDETLDEGRDHWDTSFYACGAFANELPWEEASDSNKRLQFWEWYIDDAVPRAYAQAG